MIACTCGRPLRWLGVYDDRTWAYQCIGSIGDGFCNGAIGEVVSMPLWPHGKPVPVTIGAIESFEYQASEEAS